VAKSALVMLVPFVFKGMRLLSIRNIYNNQNNGSCQVEFFLWNADDADNTNLRG